MKHRILTLTLTALTLGALLAGCGANPGTAGGDPQAHMAPSSAPEQSRDPATATDPAVTTPSTTPETSTAAEGSNVTSSGATAITSQQAMDIALADANVAQTDLTSSHVEKDYDHQRLIYEIEFDVGRQVEYEYEVDAYTGEILMKEMDQHH